MAEEFQSGICGGTWWNPSRSSSLSPCSAAGIGMATDHMGSFLWSSSDLMLDMKVPTTTKSYEESNNSVSGDSSVVFQSAQKQADSDSGGSSSILLDSTLQMMNFCPSSSTLDWNHALLRSNRRAENNYRSLMQEELNSQLQKEGSPKSFISTGDESSISIFKSINQDFSSSDNCSGLSAGFPINSASYGYSSALLQSYFEPDPQPPQSLYTNRSLNHMSAANYGTINSNDLSPSWPKYTPFLKPSLPKQQPSGLHFTNNTPYWNATAASAGLNDTRSTTGFCSLSQSQFLSPSLGEKRNCSSLAIKSNNEEVRDSGSAMKNKGSSEPPFKRPRIETPSPLPTFKVRKEKLGDRITALQQLVSPFGKTDTASVLHEAIEYIKLLQEQVNVLTAPYMKQRTQIQQQQGPDHKLKAEPESPTQDLKSRGLCLVPISSTFPVANETAADFWTPTFGGTFR